MRKVSILLLALFIVFKVSSQKPEQLFCSSLTQIIKSPVFDKQFYFSSNLKEEFIIIDTNNIFANCPMDTIMGRKIIISNSMMPKTTIVGKNNIVIVSKIRKRNRITFGFWCPANGSTLAVHYERSGKSLRLLGYNMGDM